MSKFTPGPWRIVKCGCRHPVCKMWFLDHAMSDGRLQEADARLIEAAPEMYEFLARLIDCDDRADSPEYASSSLGSLAEDAKKLLAKIDGGSHED